ncbi:hypothetical protein [Cellvibrio sp. UBA7671]|uniref:hypothetical protein n=1 Tax=Cellvibrio sp. UBA7671 TaxID=1946312 RepID=UPI002F350F82
MSDSVGRVNNMMTVRFSKSHFDVGIVDVGLKGAITKRFHLDEGLYLSSMGRICSWKSAASFDTKEEAVLFFHEWVNRNRPKRAQYKLEVIEYTTPEDAYILLFDETHPLWAIEVSEKRNIAQAARAYFYDYLHELQYSTGTLKKYRQEILKYGVDINNRVDPELNLIFRSAKIREQYHQDSCLIQADKAHLHIV